MKKGKLITPNIVKEKYGKEKRWVNFRTVKVPGRNTATKVPYSPITKLKASSTKESDWGTYDQAFKTNPEAIGIVFTPQQTLLGIDLDHCLKKDTYIIDHEQKETIANLIIEADTYTEISPSKTGLHLYFQLTEPLTLTANRHENFEAYTSGRYFTVTGIPYKQVKEIRTITPDEALALLKIIGYPWGKEEKQVTLMDSAQVSANSKKISSKLAVTDSKDLLVRMFRSKNGKAIKELYEGTATAATYKNDQSAADMALLSHLAFWTAKNPISMEALWLASPQGQREKTQKRKDYRDRSIATAISHCKEVFEDKRGKQMEAIEAEAPELDLLYVMSKGDKIFLQNTENMCRILKAHSAFKGRLQYDTFKNTLEINKDGDWVNLEDYDIVNIQTQISILFSFFGKVGKDMIYDAVIKTCRDNTVDSAIDFIKGIKWDGKDRLKVWLKETYNTPDDAYHQSVGSNWFKGLVKRICEPGCKFDYVLVLEGEQGIKKSTSLGIIGNVYPKQPSWHVETTMSTENKDFFMQFSGKAIIEFSEGETLSRTEVKRMKAIITMQSDKYRPAYGRLSLDFPRRCVFAMTTNQTEYLKDETGNRRWLPVACEGQANIDWLAENRNQLFAEAYHRVVELKETTWEFPEEEMHEAQSARRIHNPNQDLIAHWYFNELKEEEREEGITVYQVYRGAIMGGSAFGKSLSRFEEMEIADVLRNYVKLEKRRKRIDGIQSMRWFHGEKSMQRAAPIAQSDLDKMVDEFRGPKKLEF